MAEALSQNQIDELLKQMQSGKVDAEIDTAPKIKEYDFKSPKKFTKEQLKALDSLHENFSRGLSSYFTSILHNVCEVSVLQIEEQRYYEFSNALPENTLVGVIDLQSEDGKVADTSFIMDVSASFSFMTIDRLLGGNGRLIVPDRNFTEIEMAIMEDVVQAMIQYLEEAWCNYIPVTPPHSTALNQCSAAANLFPSRNCGNRCAGCAAAGFQRSHHPVFSSGRLGRRGRQLQNLGLPFLQVAGRQRRI